MALLEAVLDLVKKEYIKHEPTWKREKSMTRADMDFLKKECSAFSEFDPFYWRREMLERWKKGEAYLDCRTCEYGKVVAILDHEDQAIPWGLWGRILRLYHRSKKARVFLLANPYPRSFPPTHHEITPDCINGGYTYQCNNETIVIYRAEDATRVLIHELQHASCLDHEKDGVDVIEAKTEAWAELIYIGLLSQGNKSQFYQLLETQSEWMAIQNDRVKQYIRQTKAFPWRYTVGKEDIWRQWGINQRLSDNTANQASLRLNAYPKAITATHSLRLTAPPSRHLQYRFACHSTIL